MDNPEMFITVKNPALCQFGECDRPKHYGKYCSYKHRDISRSIREGKNCARCDRPLIYCGNLCRTCYVFAREMREFTRKFGPIDPLEHYNGKPEG